MPVAYPEELPDSAATDDPGHIDDHNKIVTAVGNIDARLYEIETNDNGGAVDSVNGQFPSGAGNVALEIEHIPGLETELAVAKAAGDDAQESVDTLSAEVVHLEGDQDVDGIKSFVVPPRTTASPAADDDLTRKAFVEQRVQAAWDYAAGAYDDAQWAQNTADEAVTALETKADLVDGTIPTSQIPAVAITEYLGEVANEAAMLALTGQRGDWCIRTDLSMVAVLNADAPTVLASWTLLEYPGAPVASVNGQTGLVVLAAADVDAEAEGAVENHEIEFNHANIPDPDGQTEQRVWTTDGAGNASWQPASGSSPIDTFRRFSTSTVDADPGNGKFRFNAATRAATTFIYMDDLNSAGTDISNFARLLQAGDKLFIQPQAVPTSTVRYVTTGPAVDVDGYWKVPVAVDVAPAGAEITNNESALMLWSIAALGGAGGASGQGLPLGLTGATSPTRYAGGTASVAPVTGTFGVGDFIPTLTGKMFVCTVAGTPGTWVQVGTGVAPRVIALTDAATITSNCETTDVATVTLAGNRTLGAPSGTPMNGQRLQYRVRQDATGSRTLAYNAIFRFGADVVQPLLSTTPAKTDYILFQYNATDSRWDCMSVVKGY
jgi:hypothetical protein